MTHDWEISDLLRAYAAEPVWQGRLERANAQYEQTNSVCWDDICVYMQIEDKKIKQFRYEGHPSMFTLAAASMLAEEIEGRSLDEVLSRGYTFMQWLGFEVSPRRQRSAVSALLAARNAIHRYLQDGKEDNYEELLES